MLSTISKMLWGITKMLQSIPLNALDRPKEASNLSGGRAWLAPRAAGAADARARPDGPLRRRAGLVVLVGLFLDVGRAQREVDVLLDPRAVVVLEVDRAGQPDEFGIEGLGFLLD